MHGIGPAILYVPKMAVNVNRISLRQHLSASKPRAHAREMKNRLNNNNHRQLAGIERQPAGVRAWGKPAANVAFREAIKSIIGLAAARRITHETSAPIMVALSSCLRALKYFSNGEIAAPGRGGRRVCVGSAIIYINDQPAVENLEYAAYIEAASSKARKLSLL